MRVGYAYTNEKEHLGGTTRTSLIPGELPLVMVTLNQADDQDSHIKPLGNSTVV